MSFIVYGQNKQGKYSPVSGEFSSPKFCVDFIELAKKQGVGGGLRIMVKQGRKVTHYSKMLEQSNLF